MKKGFTLIDLLIVIFIVGILAALLIPNIITATRKLDYNDKLMQLAALADSTAEYVESTNIPEEEKRLYKDYLNQLILDAKRLPAPKSISEARQRIAYLSQELEILQQPERLFKEINNKETITSDPMFNVYLDIYKLGAKVDTLYNERLTKWDVALIVFAVMGGLGTIVAIIAFVAKIRKSSSAAKQETGSRHQPRVIKKRKRAKKKNP